MTLNNKVSQHPRRRMCIGLWRLTILLVAVSWAEKANAGECPLLAAMGKSGDDQKEITSDLWQIMVHRDLRRYDHYKSGSASKYKHYRNQKADVYSSLSDIWLCLACAVGWTVWMVSARHSSSGPPPPTVFETSESRKIFGNVLQVTLGEDPDGTGIPVYYTLVDYIVESNTMDEEPLQVRKCFTTRKLLEEGFANVEVLVSVDDPTTSVLMDDFMEDRLTRSHQQPPDMIQTMIVYVIAAILIITSLVGGLHAYLRLDPEDSTWGKVSLAVGIIILYPAALVLHFALNKGYRWVAPLIQRPGVIINGAKNYWNHKCGATLNPLEVMGSFDGSYVASSSPTSGNRRSTKSPRPPSPLPTVMEMATTATSITKGDGSKNKTSSNGSKMTSNNSNTKRSPLYPNAGCGFRNYNVQVPSRSPGLCGQRQQQQDDSSDPYELATSSVSSMSSGGTGVDAKVGANQNLQIPDMDESSYNLDVFPEPLVNIRTRGRGNSCGSAIGAGVEDSAVALTVAGTSYQPPQPIHKISATSSIAGNEPDGKTTKALPQSHAPSAESSSAKAYWT